MVNELFQGELKDVYKNVNENIEGWKDVERKYNEEHPKKKKPT